MISSGQKLYPQDKNDILEDLKGPATLSVLFSRVQEIMACSIFNLSHIDRLLFGREHFVNCPRYDMGVLFLVFF